MKKKIIQISLLIGVIIPITSKGQCTVTKEVQNDKTISYYGKTQSIYKNEDLENGIQSVFLQMIIMQKEKGSTLLKFMFNITEYSNGGKAPVIPRTLELTFDNGSIITLEALAENPTNLTEISGTKYKTNRSMFKFKSSEFETCMKTKLASIRVIDNETKESLSCTNNSDTMLIRETKCIAEALDGIITYY